MGSEVGHETDLLVLYLLSACYDLIFQVCFRRRDRPSFVVAL
jgi:hypothetical protein